MATATSSKGYTVAKTLPRDLAASLGRMIALHSLLEDRVSNCLYKVAGVNAKIGRVAFANPRGSEIVGRIREVSQVTGTELWMSKFPWNKFSNTLDDLQGKRDIFAHSVWLVNRTTKEHVLLVTKGKWDAMPNTRAMSKRIYPEPRLVNASDLRTLRNEINDAIAEAEVLSRLIGISTQVIGYTSPKKSS
jgi:hypothetical protein